VDYPTHQPHHSTVAWQQNKIDLLVFFHGDSLGVAQCKHTFDPDPKKNSKKFNLDWQIHITMRPVILVVPRLFWIRGNKEDDPNIRGIWTAAKPDDFIDEVLLKIGSDSKMKSKPTINRLTIAAHSHAYAMLLCPQNLSECANGRFSPTARRWI
jgi:hypothetical protein